MIQKIRPYILLVFASFLLLMCKKKYDPPAITAANNFLVVDGFINANPNEATTIVLSRSKNLGDSIPNIPELHAQVSIVSNSGSSYNLIDVNNSGNYISATLNLNASSQYQIKIITADGHHYVSDMVAVKKSPPIDSLTWTQDSSLTVYLYAHDPNNNTVYYKWNFIETWEHYSPVQTFWVQNNGIISYADTTNQIDSCWSTANSATIITGTSVSLAQDVISKAPITTIPRNDVKIKARYSILVNQIPLTVDAYNYWSLIQKNSQELGTLFDPQPSQLTGNIHPITNPNEPVIGYISAATTTQKRIFVNNKQLNNWSTLIDYPSCDTKIITPDPLNTFVYTYSDTSYAPWYYTGFQPLLYITKKTCIDCREYGGITKRPSFW